MTWSVTSGTWGSADMKVGINCANARDGGAIQVGVALVEEVPGSERYRRRYGWAAGLRCVVSPQVFASLSLEVRQSPDLIVADGATRRERIRQTVGVARDCEIVYTVFAPWYGRKLAPITISGFADGRWLHPRSLRGLSLMKYLLRKPIAGYFYRRDDALVHQTAESLDSLRRYPGFRRQRMEVAPNCLNPLFVRGVQALPQRHESRSGLVTLVYVARYYPYKNHAALAAAQELLASDGTESVCLVTMSAAEWNSVPLGVRRRFSNVGITPISDRGAVYAQADLAVFPSLNESFSASPIEALLANGILVAADRCYVRGTCGDVASYVEPDAAGLARGIRNVLDDRGRWPQRRAAAREFVATLPTAEDMVDVVMGLIDEFLNRGKNA